MADELPLPRLIWNPTTESFAHSASRKRVRLSSPPVSSDPALFSSDDDPSAENYTQERRKKKFRGPWFRQRLASDAGSNDGTNDLQKRSKRTFERQYDSGIFMGSDGTDMSDEMEEIGTKETSLPLQQPVVVQTKDSPDELASSEIQLCLDEGNETIDLSSRGLTTISNATIRPLAAFVRVPPVTEGVFSRLEPKLKIFLASNELTTLPAELFNLDRLTVLSLRGNQIHEIPPSIGKLKNLKELNLSQNGLRHLPFEILDLFSDTSRLNSLNLHPNLFHEPQFPQSTKSEKLETPCQIGLISYGRFLKSRRGAVSCISPDQIRKSWHAEWKVTYQARTEVRYLDINGTLITGPSLLSGVPSTSQATPYSLPVADENYIPQPPPPRGNGLSRAPSLLETALLACSRTSQLSFLSEFLPSESPPHLHDLLDQAVLKKESGGSNCTICGRGFIIPRTEWIEWWEIAKVMDSKNEMASAASPLRQMENERDVLESMVPLMRRGCSWLCVPEKIIPLEEKPTDEMGEK